MAFIKTEADIQNDKETFDRMQCKDELLNVKREYDNSEITHIDDMFETEMHDVKDVLMANTISSDSLSHQINNTTQKLELEKCTQFQHDDSNKHECDICEADIQNDKGTFDTMQCKDKLLDVKREHDNSETMHIDDMFETEMHDVKDVFMANTISSDSLSHQINNTTQELEIEKCTQFQHDGSNKNECDTNAMFSNGPKERLKRKRISLEQKAQILDRIKCGEKIYKISKELNMSMSTICGIQMMEDKIRKRISIGSSDSIKKTARVKNNLLARTENCLMIWIEDCRQKNLPLDGHLIKKKAIKLFEHLKEKERNSEETFLASKGWFERFKKRFSLNNIIIQGERSSADEEAANIFLNQFKTIIQTEGYIADQVFNADETGLNFKKMPGRTYVSKTEKSVSGFKVLKDRITLLICSNASGDCVCKPLVINRSLKPRAMKGLNLDNLPVYWRVNKKAWVTQDIFKDWFYNCFIPDVENYTYRKNIAFKVLLIIDNAPGHPRDLYHPNVKVIFTPPNTTSLIQPLDQGIIKAFKSYYIRHTFQLIVDKLDANPNTTLLKVWNDFSILNCVEIVDSCIKELKSSTLNACWRCIWPDVVLKESRTIPLSIENDRIINIARSLGGEGFDDMNENDVNELINNNMELNEEDLVNLTDEKTDSVISGESVEINFIEPSESFSLEKLNKGLQMFKELETYFIQYDCSAERSAELKKQLEKCQAPYYKIREEMQTKVNRENYPVNNKSDDKIKILKRSRWNVMLDET